MLGPTVLSNQPATAVEELINAALGALGTKVQVTVFSGPAASLRSALAAASRMADLFSGDLIGLDASTVKLFRGAVDATADIPHRLLYSPSRSDTYLVYWNSGTSAPVRVLVDISISEPALRDPIAGTTDRIGTAGTEGRSTSLNVRGANHPLVLDFNFGAPARSYMAETRQTVLPSVEEIIAKAQEVQTGQDAAVRNYVASLRIAQHFHQSPADPAINVVTENRMFAQPPGVEWVELSFEVNGAKWTSNRPSFPILQAEKVLSLPLDLRLNQDYRYRLDGIDEIDGREAFVVKFEPVDQEHALYRGTVWIDRVGFARLKVSAVQTKNSGIVVSNEEEQIFTDVGTLNGRSILLMTRLTGRQTFLVAGRPILVEREAHMSDVRLNLPDFDATRAEVRAGDQIMYSDTDKGLRYFVNKGNTRVVSDTVTTTTGCVIATYER
jgi:hypothetical protein